MLELGTLVPHSRSDDEQTLAQAARELARHRALAQLDRSEKQAAEQTIKDALADERSDPWGSVLDLAARMQLAARIATAKGAR